MYCTIILSALSDGTFCRTRIGAGKMEASGANARPWMGSMWIQEASAGCLTLHDGRRSCVLKQLTSDPFPILLFLEPQHLPIQP